MKVGIVVANLPHQMQHAEALSEGLGKHGIEAATYSEGRMPAEPVVACWGWRLGEVLYKAGKQVLVLERGFIDRMRYSSFGWNGLNGRAARNWAGGSDKRLHALFPRAVRPWNPQGKYALVIGQVSGDMSVRDIRLPDWYAEAIRRAKGLGFPVKFRPHPVSVEYGEKNEVHGAEVMYSTLTQALEGAAVVITYNSNTGVDAVLAGKPTIVCDKGSMAWPVASHDWEIQSEPDRTQWASHLAWSQFSLEEIRSGLAWDVVKDSQTLQ